MKRKKGIVKILAVLLALLIIFQPLASINASAATTTVVYKGTVSSLGTTVGKFTVKGNNAWCAEHPKATPPTGTKIISIKKVTNTNMRKALYYGYGGPEAKVSKNNAGWVKTSVALSKANGYEAGTTSAQSFYRNLKNYATPPSSFTVYYCNTAGGKQDLCYWVYEPEGKVSVKKSTTDATALVENGYSLAGCKFGIYASKANARNDKNRIATRTTDINGDTTSVTLEVGTYYIKEISAPEYFTIDLDIEKVTITDQCDKTVKFTNTPNKGKLQLIKSSANEEYTAGNSAYSIIGAEYGVYLSEANAEIDNERVGTLTTKNEKGESNILELYADTYYIKETVSPPGYEKDEEIYDVTIKIDELTTTEVLNVEDEPIDDPDWVMLQKVDAVTGKPIPTGDGELANAEFTVKFYEGDDWDSDPADSGKDAIRSWVFKTNDNGFVTFGDDSYFVSGDELWYTDSGTPTFPIGTITIQETKAPVGYNINDEVFVVNITEDAETGGVLLSQIKTTTIDEEPIRGDIELYKTDSDTDKPLEGVKFQVIDKSEKKVVATLTTDENGYATTMSEENPEGTLPYGTYIVRETDPLIGYNTTEDYEVVVDGEKDVITIEIKNDPAKIKTSAICSESNDKVTLPMDEVTIVDTVKYENLIVGEEYIIKGKLMDKDTESPLIVNENEVTAEKTFVAETSNGSVELKFTLDASALAGKTTVVFEDLYLDDVKIATHSDIEDKDQTVEFLQPEIGTTAICDETGNHYAIAKENVTITDTINYSGLLPGAEYTMLSYLVDKETGRLIGNEGESLIEEEYTDTSIDETIEEGEYEGIIGIDENFDTDEFADVYKEIVFTPEESSGTIEVTFTFDASKLAMKDIVVFEELYAFGDFKVVNHIDIEDANQTITFIDPKIGTTAVIEKSGAHVAVADDNITIVDTVKYEGLASGLEYTVTGVLIDKDTGTPLAIDGKNVTSSATFVPETADGSIDVKFTFDASSLKNKSVVVFEKLYYLDIEIANHEDVEDVDQTIIFIEGIGRIEMDDDIDLGEWIKAVATGDAFGKVIPIIVLLLCVSGIAAATIIRKRRNEEDTEE